MSCETETAGCGPLNRHGTCHGCTDIIRVKFVVTGIKRFYENMQYDVNSLPVDFFVFVLVNCEGALDVNGC